MFGAFRRSFQLAKESFRVLRHDPELMLLTAASFVGVAIIVLLAGAIGFGTGAIDVDAGEVSPGGIVLLGLAYFAGYFIIIYFQVALASAIQFRMSGGDPDVRYALGRANHRLGAIVSWAIIAASVGLVLRLLEATVRGRGGIGRILGLVILAILGTAWSLMVFFVVPVIAAEGTGGFAAIKRSTSIIKRRWGEAIVGTQGIALVMGLATVVLAAIPFLLGMATMDASVVLGGFFMTIAVVIALAMMVASASLDSTYRAVLFAYVETGETGGFAKDTLDHAFAPRQDLRGVGR